MLGSTPWVHLEKGLFKQSGCFLCDAVLITMQLQKLPLASVAVQGREDPARQGEWEIRGAWHLSHPELSRVCCAGHSVLRCGLKPEIHCFQMGAFEKFIPLLAESPLLHLSPLLWPYPLIYYWPNRHVG